MNTIAWIILIALILEFALHWTAGMLNLSHLKTPLPDEFRACYDA